MSAGHRIKSTTTGLLLRQKWSKTRQKLGAPRYVYLHAIPRSSVCPRQAYFNMISQFPAPKNAPLFCKTTGAHLHIFTAKNMRSLFRELVKTLGLSITGVTVHSLRKSAAQLAYELSPDIQTTMQLGDWHSSAVWSYVSPDVVKLASLMAQAVENVNISH